MTTLSELDFLIGQVLIAGFEGLELDSGFEDHYVRCPSSGFILFGRNAGHAGQVRALTDSLCGVVAACNPACGTPIIGVDQEGGSLSPLKGIVTSLPGNMGIAATGDPEAARYAGHVTGCDLRALGINANFAPVLDLAREPSNPAVSTRSFGDDPGRVGQFGREYARGLTEAGILFAVKHFPGHGSSPEDSHVSLPECRMSISDLMEQDLAPFAQAVRWPGSAVMATHVRFSEIDPARPATLSRAVITGLLRGEMGFDGVVLTDCLEMNGIRSIGSVPETAVMAIEAGCDIVLVSHTRVLQEAAFAAVRGAVRSGRLSLPRLEQSVERIRRWKRGIGAPAPRGPSSEFSTLWTPELLGERVVTYVPGDAASESASVFGRGPIILVTPEMGQMTLAEDTTDISPLQDELERQGIRCARVRCSVNPDVVEIERVVSEMAGANCSCDFVDAHGHIGASFNASEIIDAMDRNGVTKQIVMARAYPGRDDSDLPGDDRLALKLAETYPGRFYPLVGMQRPLLTGAHKWIAPDADVESLIQQTERKLASGKFFGIGEFIVRHWAYSPGRHAEQDNPIYSELMRRFSVLAARYDVPMVIHMEGYPALVADFSRLMAENPGTRYVWAHNCGRSKAPVIRSLLSRFENLYCDLGGMTNVATGYGSGWPRKEE